MFTQAKSFTPASIRGLAKITNPIAGLKPREARLPSHNKISPTAESKGEKSEGEGVGWNETAKKKRMMRPHWKKEWKRKKLIWREMKLGSPALLLSSFFRRMLETNTKKASDTPDLRLD